jgi:hypothetical protein
VVTGGSGSGGIDPQAAYIRLQALKMLDSGGDVGRVGALLQLERLAQVDPADRQLTIDIVCAFLCSHAGDQSSRIAQSILTNHLSRPPWLQPDAVADFAGNPDEEFWPRIDINLGGATLDEWNVDRFHVRRANFTGATFRGRFYLSHGVFTGTARFKEAIFSKDALFDHAVFERDGYFDFSEFRESAWFNEARFDGRSVWNESRFSGGAGFRGAMFRRGVELDVAYVDYGEGNLYHFPPNCRLTDEADGDGFRILRHEP